MERYNRQMLLKNFGADGQQRLAAAKVLVIGAGGLGCPALQYLAGAGVGTIGIVDGDQVSLSNLHRQTLFATADIGRGKAEIAAQRIAQLNPDISVQAIGEYMQGHNAQTILEGYDYVLDGTDNFETRYLINDACVLGRKPLVYGAVAQHEGQVAVWNVPDERGLCLNYRDLFPEAPRSGEIPNCSEAGVLGVLPGIIGTMQAAEMIKLIAGLGNVLNNRLLTYNVLQQEIYTLELRQHPAAKALLPVDWNAFRQRDYGVVCAQPIRELSVEELFGLIAGGQVCLVDVREADEQPEINEFAHQRIPMSVLPAHWNDLADTPTIFICQSGVRSLKAAQAFGAATGKQAYSLRGGVYTLKNETDDRN